MREKNNSTAKYICDKSFSRKADMNRHTKSAHTDNSTTLTMRAKDFPFLYEDGPRTVMGVK